MENEIKTSFVIFEIMIGNRICKEGKLKIVIFLKCGSEKLTDSYT